MTVFELREKLAKIPNQKSDVIVTIINIVDTYGATTSLNEVVVSKGIVMLEGDMNG